MQRLCNQYIEAFAYSFGVVRERLLKKLDSRVDISNIDSLVRLVICQESPCKTDVLQHFSETFATDEYPLINNLPELCMEFYERTGDVKFLRSLKAPLWTSSLFISVGLRCAVDAFPIFGKQLNSSLILVGLKKSTRPIHERRRALDALLASSDRSLLIDTVSYEREIRLKEKYQMDYDPTDDRSFLEYMKTR